MWDIELASMSDMRSPIGHARAGTCSVSAEERAMETRDPASTQSVQRALRLLSLFGAPHGPEGRHRTDWTVSDLARATGLHKSVVGRLMATMAASGFVVQNPLTRSYTVGPQAFAVGRSYEPYRALNETARPRMETLTAECGHASYLGVPAGDEIMYIIAVESGRSLRVSIQPGERRPYHAGAIGKVLLSGMPDEQVRAILGPGPLKQLTPYTLTDPDAVIAGIERVRLTGIAYNHDESIVGAGSIAVGIANHDNDLIAGLGVVFPTHIVSDTDLATLTPLVIAAAGDISRRMKGARGT